MSPSINVDYQTWQPVKEYMEKELKLVETDDEQFYFSEYEPEANTYNQHTKENHRIPKGTRPQEVISNFNCYR